MAQNHKFGITIRVKDDGTVKVLDATNKQLKAIDKNAHKAGKATKFFGNHMHRMVGYATAYMGVGFAKGLIKDADALGKVADKLGVSTDMLQKYRYAAELSGVQTRTFDMALQRFTRRVAEAAIGTGEAKDALKQMGISLTTQNGSIRNTEHLLHDVARAFSNIPDQAQRVRLAFKLFDSEGVAMVNMLTKGSDEMHRLTQQAERLGIVMDDKIIRTAEDANDQLTTMGTILKTKLTIGFAHALKFAEPFIGFFIQIVSDSDVWIAALTATGIAFSVVATQIGLANTALVRLLANPVVLTIVAGTTAIYGMIKAVKKLHEVLSGGHVDTAQSCNQKHIDTMLATRARLQAQVSSGMSTPHNFGGGSYQLSDDEIQDLKETIADIDAELVKLGHTAEKTQHAIKKVLSSPAYSDAKHRFPPTSFGGDWRFYKNDPFNFDWRDLTNIHTRTLNDRNSPTVYTQHPLFTQSTSSTIGEPGGHMTGFGAAMTTGIDAYLDSVSNTFQQIQDITTRGMQGFENAIVKGTMTGKFAFKDMVNSILADIIRMNIRQNITAPLAGALSGLFKFGGNPAPSGLTYEYGTMQKRSGGGPVFGAGTGTSDSIPAWLSNGEFVINAKQTAKHRQLLEAINNGQQGFATGGLVGKTSVSGGGFGMPKVHITIKNMGGDRVSVRTNNTRTDTQGNINMDIIVDALDKGLQGLASRGESTFADTLAYPNGGAY